MTGRELEKLLIHIWYRELTDIYELPKTDEEKFVRMSLNLRKLISNGRNIFKSLYVLWQMRGELMFARSYMRVRDERLVQFIVFWFRLCR